MATRRFMLNRGETEFSVTEATGAATATKDIELTFDLAKSITKAELIIALEDFQNYVLKSLYPAS